MSPIQYQSYTIVNIIYTDVAIVTSEQDNSQEGCHSRKSTLIVS